MRTTRFAGGLSSTRREQVVEEKGRKFRTAGETGFRCATGDLGSFAVLPEFRSAKAVRALQFRADRLDNATGSG